MSETRIPDWRNADPADYEPHFCHWMLALTTEGLHDKGDIATVLAMQSAELAAARSALEAKMESFSICAKRIDELFQNWKAAEAELAAKDRELASYKRAEVEEKAANDFADRLNWGD